MEHEQFNGFIIKPEISKIITIKTFVDKIENRDKM